MIGQNDSLSVRSKFLSVQTDCFISFGICILLGVVLGAMLRALRIPKDDSAVGML